MTHFNNLGWECPVCHCGNAPTASWCWNCVNQKRLVGPRPGDPIPCAFCKGLISPGESHLCKTWERMVQDQADKVRARKQTLCRWCAQHAPLGHRCPHDQDVQEGSIQEPNTVAPPTYNGEFTSPYQGTTTSRVFMVCPVCRQETDGSHACKGTGK